MAKIAQSWLDNSAQSIGVGGSPNATSITSNSNSDWILPTAGDTFTITAATTSNYGANIVTPTKSRTAFYEYELKVYDLTADSTVKGNRLILSTTGVAELDQSQNLQNYVLVTEAKRISEAIASWKVSPADCVYEIHQVACHYVQDKND